MAPVDTAYQTFKNAVAALVSEGTQEQRVARAAAILAGLRASGAMESTGLQARLDTLLERIPTTGPNTAALEIVALFEEINAVYHVWISQAGRSC